MNYQANYWVQEHQGQPQKLSRLPGCSSQAADAVSGYTQVKMEDAPTSFKKQNEVRMSRYLDTSTKAEMVKIMVQYGRSSRFSREEFVRSPSGRAIVRKAV